MRLPIAYSNIKKRNLVLINNVKHQRETLTEWPIRLPLRMLTKFGYLEGSGPGFSYNLSDGVIFLNFNLRILSITKYGLIPKNVHTCIENKISSCIVNEISGGMYFFFLFFFFFFSFNWFLKKKNHQGFFYSVPFSASNIFSQLG